MLELEQRFFRQLTAAVPGIELQSLRDTSRLEYALARLDRYADLGAGQAGAGAELAGRLVDALAEQLAGGPSCYPPGGLPRHLGVLWPELHRESFRWRANAKRRRAADRDAKNAVSRPDGATPQRPVGMSGAVRC